jgi:hypothetical protein
MNVWSARRAYLGIFMNAKPLPSLLRPSKIRKNGGKVGGGQQLVGWWAMNGNKYQRFGLDFLC